MSVYGKVKGKVIKIPVVTAVLYEISVSYESQTSQYNGNSSKIMVSSRQVSVRFINKLPCKLNHWNNLM